MDQRSYSVSWKTCEKSRIKWTKVLRTGGEACSSKYNYHLIFACCLTTVVSNKLLFSLFHVSQITVLGFLAAVYLDWCSSIFTFSAPPPPKKKKGVVYLVIIMTSNDDLTWLNTQSPVHRRLQSTDPGLHHLKDPWKQQTLEAYGRHLVLKYENCDEQLVQLSST